jgi:hypothetical protein
MPSKTPGAMISSPAASCSRNDWRAADACM